MMFSSIRPLLRMSGCGLLLGGVTVLSCSTPQSAYEKRLQEQEKSVHHAVHSERLQELMDELGRWTVRRLPQEMEIQVEQRRRVSEVSYIAKAMADAADHIPDILIDVNLSDEHRREFVELANVLKRQSLELHNQAATLSVPEMRDKFGIIIESCVACHERFRVLPVVSTS